MIFLLPFLFCLGLIIGSFLNVLTLRVANNEPFMAPRSYCPHCHTQLAWYDNIPVVSFLTLGGQCRYCHKKISWQYPLVELATAICFILVGSQFQNYSLLPTYYTLLRDLVFTAGLIALFVFDLCWFIVPDEVSIPLIIIAVVINFLLGVPLTSLLIGASIGGGLYALLWIISRGTWVGSGDIRLGVLLGAMLGWPLALVALEVAYLVGGAIAFALLLSGQKKLGSKLPMGTFLTFGIFITLLYGPALVSWWMGLWY